jgi:hypothetical protein
MQWQQADPANFGGERAGGDVVVRPIRIAERDVPIAVDRGAAGDGATEDEHEERTADGSAPAGGAWFSKRER